MQFAAAGGAVTRKKGFDGEVQKLWTALGLIVILGSVVLGYFAWGIYRQALPSPERVITTISTILFTADTIREGQNVWQTLGGQEVGSIWGHEAYVAPD